MHCLPLLIIHISTPQLILFPELQPQNQEPALLHLLLDIKVKQQTAQDSRVSFSLPSLPSLPQSSLSVKMKGHIFLLTAQDKFPGINIVHTLTLHIEFSTKPIELIFQINPEFEHQNLTQNLLMFSPTLPFPLP